MALSAEVEQLIAEAGNFDRIAGELQAVLGQVESTASGLQVALNSEGAGQATQAALLRFNEAAVQQVKLLADISQNIHHGGTTYLNTDDHNASDLAAQMKTSL